jgi:hypothetical protein
MALYSISSLIDATEIDVGIYGAKGDRQTYSGALTVGAGANPVLTVGGGVLSGLSNVQVGMLVVLPLGGAAGAGVKATVTSFNPTTGQIGLNGSVATTLTNIAFQATGNPTIAAAGTGVTPLDVYTLTGGTFVVPAQVTVLTTKVNTVAIAAHGHGGVDGTYTFEGTSAGQAHFQFTGTITGGVLTSVVATPTIPGVYQKNPTNLAAEPIVDLNGVSGLIGATVTITMGANNVRIQGIASSISVVTTPGGYSVVPANPVSSTGPGTGVTFTMPAASWVVPTVVIGTDNAPLINAASDAIRAQGIVAADKTIVNAKLVFPTQGDFLVNDSLNFTSLSRLLIDGKRATIYSCASGLPVFDETNSQDIDNINISVTGDPTFPPRWSFQFMRALSNASAPRIAFDQIEISGTFSDAGFGYNFGSESFHPGLIFGNFTAPYALIMDSCNSSVWNASSKYIAITVARDTSQSFAGGSPGHLFLINQHPNGNGVWVLGGADHNYNNAYFFCHQNCFVIQGSSLAATAGLMADGLHVEGARHIFYMVIAATDGIPSPQVYRLWFTSSSVLATESIYGMADDIERVRFFNHQVTVAFGHPNCVYFDDPTRVFFSGTVIGNDGLTNRWTTNVPSDMTGFALMIGAAAPEFFLYQGQTADDFFIDGELTVNTVVSATSIGSSDGTVASVDVTSQGVYTNPDFPTVAFDPPLSGVTALGTVTGMAWYGDQHSPNIVAPGTGYAVGQTITLVGGTSTTAATFVIDAVNGSGGVIAFTVNDVGVYSAYPPLGATTTTGGTGTGLVISPVSWWVHEDGVTIINPGNGYTTFPGVTFSTPAGGNLARGKAIMNIGAKFDITGVQSSTLRASTTYADDTAAAAGGVALGQFYRNGSVVQIRVT